MSNYEILLTGDPKHDILILAQEIKRQHEHIETAEAEVKDLKRRLFAGKWIGVGILITLGGAGIFTWDKLAQIFKLGA